MPDSHEGCAALCDELPQVAELEARLAALASERDAARAEALLLREVLDGLEEGILVLDREDRIALANQSWRSLHKGLPKGAGTTTT